LWAMAPKGRKHLIAASNQRINLMNIFHKVRTSHNVSLKNKIKNFVFFAFIYEKSIIIHSKFYEPSYWGQDCSIICLTTQFSLYNYTTLFRQLQSHSW
jgi:hypothetical protein